MNHLPCCASLANFNNWHGTHNSCSMSPRGVYAHSYLWSTMACKLVTVMLVGERCTFSSHSCLAVILLVSPSSMCWHQLNQHCRCNLLPGMLTLHACHARNRAEPTSLAKRPRAAQPPYPSPQRHSVSLSPHTACTLKTCTPPCTHPFRSVSAAAQPLRPCGRRRSVPSLPNPHLPAFPLPPPSPFPSAVLLLNLSAHRMLLEPRPASLDTACPPCPPPAPPGPPPPPCSAVALLPIPCHHLVPASPNATLDPPDTPPHHRQRFILSSQSTSRALRITLHPTPPNTLRLLHPSPHPLPP